ncbi:MAG: zf-HC2 domain-containing protein [Lachnospiraceae bacterium]|nr:zf-HC2 domain-containing protein [Lachnospiraceae bacterium]
MSRELPCYIVKDLLPMYTEELLSPESREDVRRHLEGCRECRAFCQQMASPEPEIDEDIVEVDYLQKIRRRRRNVLACALALIVLIAAGAFIHGRVQAAKAQVRYDEATKTMVIYGKDDTNLKLPETVNEAKELDAQFDSFHTKVNLSVLRDEDEDLTAYLPGYLGRTNESIKFIRSYLREALKEEKELADRADKVVELTVLPEGRYTWSEAEDRIELEIGRFYWHREELYILALLGNKCVQWKQLGYAWYLGAAIDPYNELSVRSFAQGMEEEPYYDAYVRGGGGAEPTPENYKILMDAVSYVCLTKGMGWGTAYESEPLRTTRVYSGPSKQLDPGNEMSVFMASSLIAYLSEQYGFDTVSEFCRADRPFAEAFGTDWQTAYDGWAGWITDTYGSGSGR